MKIIIFCLIGLVAVILSFAIEGATGGSGYVKIKTLRVGSGFVRITGEWQFSDPSDCDGSGTNKNSVVLVLEETQSYNEMVSFLLAARMSDSPVQFWLNGCEIDSGKSYPKGTFLYL